MPDLLSPSALRERVIRSVQMTAEGAVVLPGDALKPIRLSIGSNAELTPTVFRIFAWNLTHGGATRSDDEYRIQLTGALPDSVPGETTLIVGWSESFAVFGAWDASVHSGRTTNSPSLQVDREVLERAAREGIAAGSRGSGDVVLAFRPELLTKYCLTSSALQGSLDAALIDDLNAIQVAFSSLPPTAPDDSVRQRIVRSFQFNLRAWDFRARVLTAYEHKCAICSQQLDLCEAAHIVPVAWPGSDDTTANGMSLCRNHHRAYDAMLISVNRDYVVEVSENAFARLEQKGRLSGIEAFIELDSRELSVIPEAPKDQPNPDYLELGRVARGWSR